MLSVHTSLVEPLPHQILAVYEGLLPVQPLRFLLADDPGAGKTTWTTPPKTLLATDWDLVVVDEAHKMSATFFGGEVKNKVKEDLLKFDGTPLFPERRAYTVSYELSNPEAALSTTVN